MPTPRNVATTGLSRVWLMEDGAGPAVVPEYMGVWRAGSVDWSTGDEEPIEIPSDIAYDEFVEVASISGAQEKPTMDFAARYALTRSDMLRIYRRHCFHDFQVHFGECGNPQLFTSGWDKIVVLERARISNYTTDDLGTLSSDGRAAVDEQISAQGTDYYEIFPLSFSTPCASSVIQEVIDVEICDSRSCGECELTSDGCQRVFAVVRAVGGSPGLGAQVVYSEDGGSTCGSSVITTLAANEDPDDSACYGDYLVVVSEDSASHHYALISELLLGTETWAEIAAVYAGGGEPRCTYTLKPGYNWIGGAGGYVYFLAGASSDPSILDSGSATTEDLNDCHAYDEDNVLLVGNNNAVIYATDGVTFTAVTGPAPGVNLNCCWMRSATEWWIGAADGSLYYTLNRGTTWTEKAFPGSGAGEVRDIEFPTRQVGLIAHDTVTPAGRILKTIDGGYQWWIMPIGAETIPANDRINALASCDPNVLFGGGLADDGADGILVKAA